jgi:MoCo/4Fe-4S cofactor protein with predicted Tat translocation signal
MKKYWKSIEESKKPNKVVSENKPEPEFSVEGLQEEEVKGLKANRRDFLKMLGFSVGYAALASSCEQPVRKAIPYLNQPEDVTPGQAKHYATTYFDGHDYCSVLAKVRDGRPIKIEGNDLSPINQGGTSARVQASVLNLYDSSRLMNPINEGQEVTDWEDFKKRMRKSLEVIAGSGNNIYLLSSSIISPSTKKILEEFSEYFFTTKIIYYDAVSYEAIKIAHEALFGKKVIPSLYFDKARVVAGFNADFQGTWLSPVEFASDFSKTRNPEQTGGMSRHYQYESILSLTGSNADKRYSIKPSDEVKLLAGLYNLIAGKAGQATISGGKTDHHIDELATELWKNKGKSIVVSGTNDIDIQTIVAGINAMLENYSNTIDLQLPFLTKNGSDRDMAELVDKMNMGKVNALLINNVNPAYDYFESDKFIEGLKKVGWSACFSEFGTETTQLVKYVCPIPNYLEAWGDAEPKPGLLSLQQPTIHPIFNTRPMQEVLLYLMNAEGSYHSYLKRFWETTYYAGQSNFMDFDTFWNDCLQKGVYHYDFEKESLSTPNFSIIKNISINQASEVNGLELTVYEKIGIGTGQLANNPWLQELPDPISKASWDNYLALSPRFAHENDLSNEDVVLINDFMELPVLEQPGQAYGTASIAMGYGRTVSGKAALNVGENAFGFGLLVNGTRQMNRHVISIKKTGKTYPLALTQTHHTMEGRPLVRETNQARFEKNPVSGNELHKINEEKAVTLYKKPQYVGHHWGIGVDLNKCIGCSACVIGCQSENNVAVIGKAEVKNRRIMHWLRIDRYYTSSEEEMERHPDFVYPEWENPQVVHQPVMCQHCDNAPCENVCPVAATPHSKEGLNQMAYNRCIGTRYCMNNCPYRVRRFNWYEYSNNPDFDYNFNSDLGKMAINPDVVVRSRGVVEKCSFCVQRIQEKKLEAKKEGRMLKDEEIHPACVQACPTKALVFGDRNNKESNISKHFNNPRNYHLLEELHTLASVGYLTKVRNVEDDHSDEHHNDHH